MATSMNFALSPTYRNNLTAGGQGNGVFAYAIAYAGANQTASVALVTNGHAATAPSLALTTDASPTFVSGKVYIVVIQQAPSPAPSAADFVANHLTVGSITPANAQTENYRYDLVEVTLSGPGKAGADVADISAINQFGSTLTIGVGSDIPTMRRS